MRTHVAFIAEVAGMPDKLPEVFIANRKLAPRYVQDEVPPTLPPSTRMWSVSSSRIHEYSMCRILRLLHESIREDEHTGYILGVFGMAGPRAVESVTALARELHIIRLFVSAKLTCLLQPLDLPSVQE